MQVEIKAVKEAFTRDGKRWEVNKKSEFGIQKILMQLETHKNPPHPDVSKHMYIAYDSNSKVMFKWQIDAVNVEYF
jgi:hypothetical protein